MSQSENLEEPMYDADDVARILKLNKKTLYTLIRRGQGPPSIRIGHRLRFPPRGFREWLDLRKT